MGKKSAPKADPRMGQAAVASAELGREYLSFMREQSKISNRWAEEDRNRHKTVFEPLQDAFIQEAQGFDTPERQAEAARVAVSDVRQQASLTDQARRRSLTRMGVDPRSGRFAAENRRADTAISLAAAGAANNARRGVEAQGRSLRAAAVDLGSGGAVNPATSLGMANGAMSSGFSGAMRGQGQMSNILGQEHNSRMNAWSASNAAKGQLFNALGNVAGTFMLSSKELKTDKKPVRRSLLKEVRSMPVEDWKYKDGVADGERHTGPYAEDFQKATGKGDGKTINLVDAIGVTMGAVQELDKTVQKLVRRNVTRGNA